jgi:hypothetical protein
MRALHTRMKYPNLGLKEAAATADNERSMGVTGAHDTGAHNDDLKPTLLRKATIRWHRATTARREETRSGSCKKYCTVFLSSGKNSSPPGKAAHQSSKGQCA